MPFIDHNPQELLERLAREGKETRDLLRQLRHTVEHGHLVEPPKRLVSELGRHAALLAHCIAEFTVRHEHHDHAEYQNVMAFVAAEARSNPHAVSAPAVHVAGPDEYTIYRDVGFSEQEYKDLQTWKQAWDVHKFDPEGAFQVFVSEVVSELQAARYTVKADDIVPGVAGVFGIGVDVALFSVAVATGPLAVVSLVASCTTGLAAIASKFSVVRQKLLGRGR